MTPQMMQKDRFIHSFRDLSLASRMYGCEGMSSAVSVNDQMYVWQNTRDPLFQKTISPSYDHIYRNYRRSNSSYFMNKPLETIRDNSTEKSYANRLRQASATVWCEYDTHSSVNVKMNKNKNNFGQRTSLSIKSLVFPHASTTSFSRPMAQYARSINNAAPQHTMLMPRLSATETCFEGDHDENVSYSFASVNNPYISEKNGHDLSKSKISVDANNLTVAPLKKSFSRRESVQSFATSSHYSHHGFASSSPIRSPSKNSVFSKNYNECTDNTLNTSPSPQRFRYKDLGNLSNTSVNEDSYHPESTRKLYIVNRTDGDILSDDDDDDDL
ncbi:hypothetical protein PCANB_002479 [Pneumocystis canis]|nr:hypothetical protein PCANB_002479 [Pneumocystis canis]